MQLASDVIARALTAFPCQARVYTGPDRLRVYSGDGACIAMPPRPVGAHLVNGAAAAMAALEVARSFVQPTDSAVDLWCCKWGVDAWVFRCAIGELTYALNVARDLGVAARAVVAAATAMAEDYAHDSAGIVRPLGLHSVNFANETLCPVLVTEWANLDELHVYPGRSQVFAWKGQRESDAYPLSAAASRLVRETVAMNRRRYSWPIPIGWCVDVPILEAGDYVGDGAGIVKKIWSRKVLVHGLAACATDPGQVSKH